MNRKMVLVMFFFGFITTIFGSYLQLHQVAKLEGRGHAPDRMSKILFFKCNYQNWNLFIHFTIFFSAPKVYIFDITTEECVIGLRLK